MSNQSKRVAGDSDGWSPYVSSDAAPWDLARAVHRHRRAGFAATWAEIERDLRDGPEDGVTRVLQGQPRKATK
jgi:hypothetical protein